MKDKIKIKLREFELQHKSFLLRFFCIKSEYMKMRVDMGYLN